MLTKHFRLVLVKAAASFCADSVNRLLSAGPVFRTISIVNVFIEKENTVKSLYCVHPPDGELVSLIARVRNGGNLFQSNVCNLFFARDLAAVRILGVSVMARCP